MAIRPSLLHSRRPTLNWTTALTLAREQTRQRPTRPDALPRSDEAAEIVGVSMRIARAKTSSPAGLGRVFRCRYASDARHDSNPRYSDLVPVRYLLDPDRLAGLGPNTPWIRPIPLARPERFELPTFGSVVRIDGCGPLRLFSVCPANRRFRRMEAGRRLRRFPDRCLSWRLS